MFRNKVFWGLDDLKGSRLKKHYEQIKDVNQDPFAKDAIKSREDSLLRILEHTKNTVPYYRSLNLNSFELSRFPVINKSLIRNNYELFRSRDYLNTDNFQSRTSGSTGTPFIVFQNWEKRLRNTADTLYFAQGAGHSLGGKLYYMRIWTQHFKKSPIIKWMQNVVMVDITNFNDIEIEYFLKQLALDGSKKHLLAYASSLNALGNYLKRKEPDLRIKKVNSVISFAESLQVDNKRILEKFFNCSVFARYSNTENGILSQQLPRFGENYVVNMASYHLEILDLEIDVPVNNGSLGRIVVTDFYNRAMPMIRYDTGDIGSIETLRKDGKNFTCLNHLEGRSLDLIYNTENELISGMILANVMYKFEEVIQYQFIQTNRQEYTIKLNIDKNFTQEKEMVQELRFYLGKNANVTIEFVNEIPLLKSGKRKCVINQYNPN